MPESRSLRSVSSDEMTKIAEIFAIPERVHQGDFVLRLTEGVNRPQERVQPAARAS